MAGKSSNNASSKSKPQQRGRNNPVKQNKNTSKVFSPRVKQDICAIAVIVVAIALLVMVAIPSNAVVSSAVSNSLQLVFGIGSLLLPIFMFIIGLILLVRTEKTVLPLRMTIGFIIIFISILGIVSLNSFGASSGTTEYLFSRTILMDNGGYVGSGIAWVGLTLFGRLVSLIILIGFIAIGLAIIGISVSSLIAAIKNKRESRVSLNNDIDATNKDGLLTLFHKVKNRNSSENTAQNFEKGLNTDKTTVFKPLSPGAKSSPKNIQDEFSNQQTMFISDENCKNNKKQSRSSKHNSNRLSIADTVLLSTDSQPMTRKLGEESTKNRHQSGKSNATKINNTAAPLPDDSFELPTMDMLAHSQSKKRVKISEDSLSETADILGQTLSDFGIDADVVGWVAGPTVTLFKVSLPNGVRVNRITALDNDIALALAAPGVRIFAPIPGTNFVGIEVPNKQRETVLLSDVLGHAPSGPLQVAIGEDVEGNKIVSDLAKMPHLLIGGTTGSGKSVCINAMIMSMLMRATPSEVRLIMIDPKRVEFTPYNGIPHLYVPVVTEPKEAASALSWGVAEMERRLKVFSEVGVRNIGQYNARAQISGDDEDKEQLEELPYIVIIIDELADLMMNVGKEVEFSISRLAQLARAAGIHLIVATQRPSTKVVTGLIKANITNRISFNVASGIDSRVILDSTGAENLIGNGDLLLSKPELAKPQRIQGCFVSEEEINTVVEHLKSQGTPEYHDEILKTNLITLGETSPDGSGGSVSGDDDPKLWEAADIVVSSGLGSTSNLQRRLKVGYSRAGRIMDMLEEKGIVGPPNGSKPREVLVDEMELETLKAFELNDE